MIHFHQETKDIKYMNKKIKHLEFIQNIIDRQAKNSFLLKGWAITLVVATFALSVNDEVFRKTLLVCFLILLFWALDSYYLWQERKFRCLYDSVRKLKDDKIDFDMNSKEIAKKEGYSWKNTALSPTLLFFYLTLLIFTIIFSNWR